LSGRRLLAVDQGIDFLPEALNVGELPVNRGKPNVGNAIQFLEVLYDQFSDCGAGHFDLAQVVEVLLDLVYRLLNIVVGHRSFGAGFANACGQLVPAELLPASVLLDHHEAVSVKSLVSSEAGVAVQTLPSPSDAVVDAS